MATRPDIAAFASHEERVRAFMASVPKRLRARVAAKYQVLSDWRVQRMHRRESSWDPAELDELEIVRTPVMRAIGGPPELEEA